MTLYYEWFSCRIVLVQLMEHMCELAYQLKIKFHLSEEKCVLTQNIMAACSFDMQFMFVWVGWEDSAHNTRIFFRLLRIEI
jgi:hypothetical protein